MKKMSPQAVIALKEALIHIYWKKSDLKSFLKLALVNNVIVSTINWDVIKRKSVDELIERMIRRFDIYEEDLINLIIVINDFNDFSHLEFWDDGTKIKKAKESVESLRLCTKGYISSLEEKKSIEKRESKNKIQLEKKDYFESCITKLKEKFYTIYANDNLQERGFQFEIFLIELLDLYDLDPKGSIKNHGEQIDGSFLLKGINYLIEAKWKTHVRREDLSSFHMKIESKLKNTLGLFITFNGVTSEAISNEFKSMIIIDGQDIMAILERRIDFPDLILKKKRIASEKGNIYISINEILK